MAVVITLLVGFVSIFILQPLAINYGLVDQPDARKHHEGAIPLIGGMAIFFALAVGCVWAFPNNLLINLYLISAALIVFLGVLDDYHDLRVRIRVIAQALIAAILVFGAGHYLAQLGNILGTGPVGTFVFGPLLTILAVLAAINAFNMTDGIDGLAGSLAFTTFGSVALLWLMAGQLDLLLLPLVFIAALLPYLLFNLSLVPGPVKKIFMGDAGSMLIGLSVIWLLVLGTQGEDAAFRPVTALWIIAVPFLDMSAIVVRRIRKGQSPFKPDRNHLHHIFMRAGLGPRGALLVITLLSWVYAIVGMLGEVLQIPEAIMFYLFVALFLVYTWCIHHIWRLLRFFHQRFSLPAFLQQ